MEVVSSSEAVHLQGHLSQKQTQKHDLSCVWLGHLQIRALKERLRTRLVTGGFTYRALWSATRVGRSARWPHTKCWGPPGTGRSSRNFEPSPSGGWRSETSSLYAGSKKSRPSSRCFSHWLDQTESQEELKTKQNKNVFFILSFSFWRAGISASSEVSVKPFNLKLILDFHRKYSFSRQELHGYVKRFKGSFANYSSSSSSRL